MAGVPGLAWGSHRNTTEMSRTHGPFIGKGILGPCAVSEGMAVRSHCLPEVPPAGPGEETKLQKTGGVPEEPCLHDIGFC